MHVWWARWAQPSLLSPSPLSWRCRQHVATCRRRHNVSLQFWPDGSMLPTQNLRCRGSLCRLEPTFPKFLEFVCRNILWYGSTYAQYYSTLIISWFCYSTNHRSHFLLVRHYNNVAEIMSSVCDWACLGSLCGRGWPRAVSRGFTK